MRYTLGIILILLSTSLFAQPTAQIADERVGQLKTIDGKMLGYAFVAMNKNVVFTAADNITFDQEMVYENPEGKTFKLRVVATDKVGNIGVLMSGTNIHDNPYALNLNYTISGDTELESFVSDDQSVKQSSLMVVAKNSKIEKSKEFKFVDVFIEGPVQFSGSPILNANGEVIGLVSSHRSNDDNTSVLTASIMDGQMWKKM